jgi:division protein CdvB (Snf7/Vps24/ESCRT-III family)
MSRQYRDTMKSGTVESQKRYMTEISQITNIGDGFKKMKFNQMETLKELKQEYEILRNLPLQDEFLKHSHTKKQNSSDFEGSRVQS